MLPIFLESFKEFIIVLASVTELITLAKSPTIVATIAPVPPVNTKPNTAETIVIIPIIKDIEELATVAFNSFMIASRIARERVVLSTVTELLPCVLA